MYSALRHLLVAPTGLVVSLLCAVPARAQERAQPNVALIARREETVIAAVNFFVLPLTFLSTTFMQKSLIPKWMQHAASFNPVNWAVEAGRSAVLEGTDWTLVLTRLGLLAALSVACVLLATHAFRSYQRAV